MRPAQNIAVQLFFLGVVFFNLLKTYLKNENNHLAMRFYSFVLASKFSKDILDFTWACLHIGSLYYIKLLNNILLGEQTGNIISW